jgi:PEP-CTERM motif
LRLPAPIVLGAAAGMRVRAAFNALRYRRRSKMLIRYLVRQIGAAALTLALWPAGSALGAITMPDGDVFQDGSFENLLYGTTGKAALTPLLYVGEFGSTLPAKQQAGFELAYSYSFAGLGTSVFSVIYTITNNDFLPFTDLRFIVDVQPDGGGNAIPPTASDTTSEFWGAQRPGDPDKRQIHARTVLDTLVGRIASNDGLDDGDNSCVGACDAELALEWDIPQLAPGETWTIGVALVDDPSIMLSERWVRAIADGTSNTVLTVSAVPEPSTYAMLFGGLVVLGLAGWRRRAIAAA